MNPMLYRSLLLLIACLSSRVLGGSLAWHEEQGARWAALALPENGAAGFTLLNAGQTGISFTNVLSEYSIATNRVMANGGGVAVGDYDRDGLPDIFLCGLESPSVLYRNLGGWHFTNVTAAAGIVLDKTACRGAVFADMNGDGFLDLLVATFNEGVRYYLNDTQGHFKNVTAENGTGGPNGSSTMTLADVDGNGSLDLYVANYRTDDIRDRGRLSIPAVNGKPVIPLKEQDHFVIQDGRIREYGQPDQLFLNDGSGHLHPASWTDGTFLDEDGRKLERAPLDWGLAATFRDVNGDQAPDLYVCNDYWTPDRFWINDGHGHFRAIDRLALRRTSSSSMGIDFADIDRDGTLDFFVVDMLSADLRLRKRQSFADKPPMVMIGSIEDRPQIMQNTLFRGRGDGSYAEIANFAHVVASDWSWSPIFVDVDLDGYEDLLISGGHFHDVQDLDAQRVVQADQRAQRINNNEAARQQAFTKELLEHYRLYPPLDMPVRAFHNTGRGSFSDVTGDWGVGALGIHHGMALGDFDQDGDLDLVVNNLNGAAAIYRNNSAAGRVMVRLKGKAPNTQGIGAKVVLLGGAIPRQTTEIIAGGRYLSGAEACAMFATGGNKDAMTLEVLWRSGTRSVVKGISANRIYEIDETSAQPVAKETPPVPQPLLRDVSERIGHTHNESDFNDFERQPLLPFKLSQSGPGIAWFDINDDGHDDLVIGAGRGSAPAVFLSDGRGGFTRSVTTNSLPDDALGVVGWVNPSGKRQAIVALSGYETAGVPMAEAFQVEGQNLVAGDSLEVRGTGAAALAIGDLDGNGQMALFVSGGVAAGRYPLGAPCKLFRWIGGQWKLDTRNTPLFGNVGIVNGVVWSDLTGDGIPELILACEWGPIRVFQSRDGLFYEVTNDWGLSAYTGWWKGVTTGDLDGDGKMDIVAANWGANSPYQATEQQPLTLAYGELFRPGVIDLLETEYDPAQGNLTPRRQLFAMAASLPFLFEQFNSHKAYSEATLVQVLGERKVLAKQVTVNTLESMVFLNRGGKFEAAPLPAEAQLAPAFGVSVADFDGDGNEDIFLGQNFFAMQPEVPRMDGGRGLLLRGDGTGKFAPVPGQESGIKVYGEQRGLAVGDFNEDGRVDVVVSQNGAQTKLFENVGKSAGVRIKLKGAPANPSGVGGVIRMQSGNRFGPAREIHAGSGYLSQDSATQVMARPAGPMGIWVRWPGGRVTTNAIPSDAAEVEVQSDGTIKRIR